MSKCQNTDTHIPHFTPYSFLDTYSLPNMSSESAATALADTAKMHPAKRPRPRAAAAPAAVPAARSQGGDLTNSYHASDGDDVVDAAAPEVVADGSGAGTLDEGAYGSGAAEVDTMAAAGLTVSEEEQAPDLMTSIFNTAKIRDILNSNIRNDMLIDASPSNVFLRPDMNFSIVLRAASMVSKLFEMVSGVLSRGGGKENKSTIGFTIIMLKGNPHLAVDVWDESKTIMVSVRVAVDVHINERLCSNGSSRFPVFRVSCKSMVEKLSHAKDFHRVMIYQKSTAEDILELLIETPDKSGNVQHETISISSDEWQSFRFGDVTHEFTLQLSIKTILQLCKVQHDGAGRLTLTIYDMNKSVSRGSHGSGAGGSGSGSGSGSGGGGSGPSSPLLLSTRERNYYILKLEAENSMGEVSSTMRQFCTETEKSMDPVTKEVTTTVHFVETEHRTALDLIDLVTRSRIKYRQSFASGFISAFLAKFDANKLVTLRVGAETTPMVMSYCHGELVVCQMVIAPKAEEEEDM